MTKRPLQVLIVEDSENDCELLLRELSRGGYAVRHRRVQTADELRSALAEGGYELIISDYSLPKFSAPAALAVVKDLGVDLPFIIISGTIGEDIAVEALKAGAHDFMLKNRLARLVPAIERELREVAARRSQREAELARRATEARFRAIMEAASDAVVSADAEGRILYVNPATERMFGHTAAELLGEPITRLLPPRFHEALLDGLARCTDPSAEESPGRTTEFLGLRKDGSEFPMDLSLGTWSVDGEVSFACIVRDATERKKFEAQLLVADRMVSVGTLAAGVAHEINNPLAAVLANLDLSLQDAAELAKACGPSDLAKGLLEQLHDAREAAERVRHIVRDIKVFSRGEQEPRGPVDVEKVMESSLRMARNEIKHRARLVKEYGGVPPVEASESRLGQVVLNLVVNAAQAMTEGRAHENEIRVATRTDGDRVVIEIADTGPGIPPEVMRRLFTPFVTTKPAGMGTGLGLSICHRIVTEFGGTIDVDSEPGRGTRFRVSLPQARDAVEAPETAPAYTGKASRRGSVLIVDDEPIIGKAVQRAIGPEHEVVALHRAREALERIGAGTRFDLIFCDLMMPEMTGMDFHRELSRFAPDQADAIVFLTGGAFTSHARDFLERVANPRLEKPFDALHLRALVNDWMRKRQPAGGAGGRTGERPEVR